MREVVLSNPEVACGVGEKSMCPGAEAGELFSSVSMVGNKPDNSFLWILR